MFSFLWFFLMKKKNFSGFNWELRKKKVCKKNNYDPFLVQIIWKILTRVFEIGSFRVIFSNSQLNSPMEFKSVSKKEKYQIDSNRLRFLFSKLFCSIRERQKLINENEYFNSLKNKFKREKNQLKLIFLLNSFSKWVFVNCSLFN